MVVMVVFLVVVVMVTLEWWRLNGSQVFHMTGAGPSTLRMSEKKLIEEGVAAVGGEIITPEGTCSGSRVEAGQEWKLTRQIRWRSTVGGGEDERTTTRPCGPVAGSERLKAIWSGPSVQGPNRLRQPRAPVRDGPRWKGSECLDVRRVATGGSDVDERRHRQAGAKTCKPGEESSKRPMDERIRIRATSASVRKGWMMGGRDQRKRL